MKNILDRWMTDERAEMLIGSEDYKKLEQEKDDEYIIGYAEGVLLAEIGTALRMKDLKQDTSMLDDIVSKTGMDEKKLRFVLREDAMEDKLDHQASAFWDELDQLTEEQRIDLWNRCQPCRPEKDQNFIYHTSEMEKLAAGCSNAVETVWMFAGLFPYALKSPDEAAEFMYTCEGRYNPLWELDDLFDSIDLGWLLAWYQIDLSSMPRVDEARVEFVNVWRQYVSVLNEEPD